VIGSDAHTFGRLITAMVTPFDDELKIDHKALEKVIDHLIKNGTDTIVVSGTTGESPTLDDNEKKELLKAVLGHAKGRAKVVMGTGSNDTAKSIKASCEAEQLGADGLLLVAPYYNKPNQDGLLAHYEAILNATSLPGILYNIPGRTGINVSVDTTVELGQRCRNLHALKDSTGSVEQAGEIASKARKDFRIYSGDDYLTLPFLAIGGCGVISVASHIIGKPIKEMITSFLSGDLDGSRALHYEFLPIFKGIFTAPNPTCIKYALSTMGICKPHLRLPLVPLSGQTKENMDRLLKEFNTKAVIA